MQPLGPTTFFKRVTLCYLPNIFVIFLKLKDIDPDGKIQKFVAEGGYEKNP